MELWIDVIHDHEELPLGGEYKGNKVNQYPGPPVEHIDLIANGHRDSSESDLSPQIMNQINAIRKSMEIRSLPNDFGTSDDEPLDRLNELML